MMRISVQFCIQRYLLFKEFEVSGKWIMKWIITFSAEKKRKEKKEDVCLLIKSETMARFNLESNYDCLENDEKCIMVLSEFMRL